MSNNQFINFAESIVSEQIGIYDMGNNTSNINEIPPIDKIPLDSRGKAWHWLRIRDVICVFVDMKGSTQLSATRQDTTMAGAYQLFTNTAVRLFHAFEAPYIDIKGDGVFALFNNGQHYRALAATVTFKTFVDESFTPIIKKKTKDAIVGGHYGIDRKTVLVRRIGLKDHPGREDTRNNEVWAGKPINMAAKLVSLANRDELLVSDRYFENLQSDLALKSCGCGEPVDLWTPKDLSEFNQFDFNTAYRLRSNWCKTHGKEYCRELLKLDSED
jgi:class 3 adenylate cyclase